MCPVRLRAFLAFCLVFPGVRAEAEPEPVSTEPSHARAHPHEHGDDQEPVENIVVTATPLPHQRDELAAPVVRVGREEILNRLGPTLGETLAGLPGVTTSGFTAGASRPVIRGQDAFRTEVLEGSLPTHGVSRLSPDHAVPVNPVVSQAVEVVRGPGVLRYGGGASAGVVNVITQRIPEEPVDSRVEVDAVGSYQSNGEGANFGGMGRGGIGNFAWSLDGLYNQTDDYETGEGTTQAGSFTETWGAAIGGAYLMEQGRLGFSYNRYDSAYGIPGTEPVNIDMRTNRYRFEGDWEEPIGGVRKISLRGVYSDYSHEETANGVVGQTFDNEEFDGRLEAVYAPWLGIAGAVGLHARHQDLAAGGEAIEYLSPSKTSSVAGYVFVERVLGDAFDIQAGLRAEGSRVEGTPISGAFTVRSFVPVSGSLALIHHVSDSITLGASGTVGQRAPSQVELFARGPHEATGTYEQGDPALDEETAYTGEFRVTGTFDRLTFEASAFATYYDDFIFGQLTGVRVDGGGVPNPVGDFEQLFYRARRAAFYGAEFTIGSDLVDLWGGSLRTDWQVDYVRAQFVDGTTPNDTNVPRIPPLRWGGSLGYEHDELSASFGFLRYEAQWDPASNEFATGAYTLLELSLGYRPAFFAGSPGLELHFVARNLLDEAARNAVSFTKDEVLLPGRNFRLSLRGTF